MPDTPSETAAPTIFLTGATGYIGGRLAPRLLQRGYRLRCLARSRAKLLGSPWAGGDHLTVIEGGARDVALLTEGMRGCDAAYFLIHSIDAGPFGVRGHPTGASDRSPPGSAPRLDREVPAAIKVPERD